MAEKKTLDLLKEAFDLSKRRKFDVKDNDGKTVSKFLPLDGLYPESSKNL